MYHFVLHIHASQRTPASERNRSCRHTCYQQKSANSTRVCERFSFSLLNYAEMRICFIETEIWNGRKGGNAPNNASDTFNGDASHSKRTMKASNSPRRLCFHAHLYTKYPTGLKGRQPITMHQPTMYRSGPAAAGNPSRRTS